MYTYNSHAHASFVVCARTFTQVRTHICRVEGKGSGEGAAWTVYQFAFEQARPSEYLSAWCTLQRPHPEFVPVSEYPTC